MQCNIKYETIKAPSFYACLASPLQTPLTLLASLGGSCAPSCDSSCLLRLQHVEQQTQYYRVPLLIIIQ